jgi:LmbE family N-acetylglucosaminyl deacetylase
MLEKRTILGIFAHPDDETFGPGGTLAKYAASGANVHVIIGTDGDAGSVEAAHKRGEGRTLAQERQEELTNAALLLGITTIWNLPYRDSGMRGSPDNEHPRALIRQPITTLIAELTDYIRRMRPQVIITHDPFGGYGHPDHIRLCEVVTAAFYQAGNSDYYGLDSNLTPYAPQKLYFRAYDRKLLQWIVRFMNLSGQNPRQVGRNRDINLEEISAWEIPIHAEIDITAFMDQKERASQAHASQYGGGPSYMRVIPAYFRRRLASKEQFSLAYPSPYPKQRDTDLFAGVRLA